MSESALRKIFMKTHGHCHFCGDPIVFDNRGWDVNPSGHWEVDHVVQRDKGGSRSDDNCLPACTRCNRLRWHRTGEAVRELLLLGVIAKKEIMKCTRIGNQLSELKEARMKENEERRRRRRPGQVEAF
jgi:5-methylcytosine-specific restriction endonuclease McrA